MSLISSSFQTPSEAVTAFYERLHGKDFSGAFDCLTLTIKEARWANDLQRFADGYEYTTAIDQIACTVLEEDGETARCHLRYRDAKDVLCHPLLEDLQPDALDASSRIMDFKQFMVEKLQADPIKTMAIPEEKAFQPNAVEIMTWLGTADRVKIQEHLTERKPFEEITARHVTCVKEQDGWLINAIGPAPVVL